VNEIGTALRALLSEEDLPEDHGLGMDEETGVAAVFHNMLVEEVHIHRVDGDEDSSVGGGGVVKSGASYVVIATKGDKFTAYGADGQKRGDYMVTADAGGANDFTIPTAM